MLFLRQQSVLSSLFNDKEGLSTVGALGLVGLVSVFSCLPVVRVSV
jgi:hypothetical protein